VLPASAVEARVYPNVFNFSNVRYVFRRFPKIGKSDYWIRHVCQPAKTNLAPLWPILVKFDICVFFENLSRISSSIKI
jgi:hypothetical protein